MDKAGAFLAVGAGLWKEVVKKLTGMCYSQPKYANKQLSISLTLTFLKEDHHE
jgi:hypothetical protein